MKRTLGIILLLVGLAFYSFGQNEYSAGIMPEINLNKKWSEKWRTNFKVESRFSFSEGTFDSTQNHHFSYLLSDISAVGSYKIGLNTKLAFGYLLRMTTSGVAHRAILQYSIVKSLRKGRLGNRIATDQTFQNGSAPQFRLRYRLSFDIPLQGLQVDAHEFYFKLSNAYFGIYSNRIFDLEARLVPSLGFAFNDTNKLELGLDYRLKEIFNAQRHEFWTTVSWFYSF